MGSSIGRELDDDKQYSFIHHCERTVLSQTNRIESNRPITARGRLARLSRRRLSRRRLSRLSRRRPPSDRSA
eukprot:31204-Pelagococcus_subviridis.AAC.6